MSIWLGLVATPPLILIAIGVSYDVRYWWENRQWERDQERRYQEMLDGAEALTLSREQARVDLERAAALHDGFESTEKDLDALKVFNLADWLEHVE